MILTYKEILEEGKMITSKGRTYTISLPNGKELTYVNKDNLLKCIIDNYICLILQSIFYRLKLKLSFLHVSHLYKLDLQHG